jgi:hypothetical protein
MALFDAYRISLGEYLAIHAAPGHIFDESDSQQVECLFDLALYFLWDVSVFDEAGIILVKASHDEYISIHAKEEARLRQFQDTFDRIEIERFNGVP